MQQELLTFPEHTIHSRLFCGVHDAQSLFLCVLFCRSVFVLSLCNFSFGHQLSDLLRFTTTDEDFGIFKLSYHTCHTVGRFRIMVFNATFNNISVISWWSVFLVKETENSKKTPICCKSLTNFLMKCCIEYTSP